MIKLVQNILLVRAQKRTGSGLNIDLKWTGSKSKVDRKLSYLTDIISNFLCNINKLIIAVNFVCIFLNWN